ncbi:MAG: class I SAM-dependent methyltransferase [Flavobacteriales bacterium]|nr:class I SAM-dependent methyltransferase [Flavobacteriales bacterium]
MTKKNYIEINRSNWNSRVEVHVNSEFYNTEHFSKGNSSLNSIELDLLSDIKKKKIIHLQCHFGQDSISLARLGAEVAGLDFSEKAISKAIELSQKENLNIKFVCADVYDATKVIKDKYDIVFTSYGTIGWLPDLNKWANTIKNLLKPGGKLIFVEFHPAIWMFDDNFKEIQYSYFNREEIIITSSSTYTDGSNIDEPTSISWNHSLSEVFQALKQAELEVIDFKEYDYSPYNCFNNTVQIEDSKYQIRGLEGKLPMVYSIIAQTNTKA